MNKFIWNYYKPHLHLEHRSHWLDDDAFGTFESSSSSLSDDIDDKSDASLSSSLSFKLKPNHSTKFITKFHNHTHKKKKKKLKENKPRYKSFEIVRRRFRRSFMSSDDERLLLCKFIVLCDCQKQFYV